MIGIIKRNLFINSLLLLPYLILLRIHTFIEPAKYEVLENDTYLVKLIFNYLDSPLGQSIIAALLVYLQAVYLNRLVIRNKIALEISLIPGLVYILFASFPIYGILSPQLIVNSTVLLVLGQLFRLYKTHNVADNIFNVGFFIGLSALIVPSFIVLIVLGLIGISILRSLKTNQFVQLISGLFSIYFLYGGIMYLNDHSIYETFSALSIVPSLSILNLFNGNSLIVFLIVISLSMFYIFNYRSYTIKKAIQSRKKVDVVFFSLLFSLLVLLFVQYNSPYQIFLWIIPASILTSMNFQRIKYPILQEIIHIVVVALIIVLSFGWL